MSSSNAVLRNPALRLLEQRHPGENPPLMERAGQAAARVARDLLANLAITPGQIPLVIAGPGNNGGDAFVVARLLREAGYAPLLVFAGERSRLPPDAQAACNAWLREGGILNAQIPACPGEGNANYALVIDGLFGIGLKRAPEGEHARIIEQINAMPCPVLALDIPSGLDSETGCTPGVAIRATHTATFIALKPGLLTNDGPDHCGRLSLHDLGLAAETREIHDGRTITPELFAGDLRPRAKNSHKGSHGRAVILGGASGMAGAALLAGRAALSLGAGRVFVGMLDRIALDTDHPELMLREADDALQYADCLAIGPGLGQSNAARRLLDRAIGAACPLLLDADALNLLATHPGWPEKLARRKAKTLLTPHPAEAARLLGISTREVQSDRISHALQLAKSSQSAVLLKGCGSLVALPEPSSPWFINTSGNPGLATAGSGDVLSGMVLALLAQGWEADHALLAATHLHGAAADACVAAGIGPIGLRAGEIIEPARRLLNQWVTQHAQNSGDPGMAFRPEC